MSKKANAVAEPLSDCVREALEHYYAQLNGFEANGLYQLVLEQVERPMFECVMKHSGGNQSKAAAVLGISRATLRKKLRSYKID